MFYDLNHDQCGIHSARPSICRAFGYFNNLLCFRMPGAAAAAHWTTKDKH
ncbi:hypothetical protein [Paenibacillus sp. N3.4]